MKFEPEFKEVISHLTPKDKDKLILRLLKRDLILANRLYFELLSTDTVQDRRSKIEDRIKTLIKRKSATFQTPEHLLKDMRDLSSSITEHVKITKDAYGEISLNLLMLNESLKLNQNKISKLSYNKIYKLYIYIIARTFKILILTKSLDEDYLIDFEDDLKTLAGLIEQNTILLKLSKINQLNLEWLYKTEIPDNIVFIHRDLRTKGLLKMNSPKI